MDACPSGQAIQEHKRRRGIGCMMSCVSQYHGDVYGGLRTRMVTAKDPDYSWQRWGSVS